jgi:hypothetical protein
MPIELVPSGVAPTQYIAPDDGDFVDGASVQQTAQPLVDQVARLTQKTAGARTLFETLQGMPSPTSAFRFLFGSNGWVQSNVAQAGEIWFPLGPFPRNQTDAPLYLAEVTLNLLSPGHSSLPAVMPQFSLWGFNAGGGFLAPIDGPWVDASASTSAYNNEHQINGVLASPLALDFLGSGSGALLIKVEGETGANSLAGLTLLSIKTSVQETP